MLKYNIRLNNDMDSSYVELDYWGLYFDPNGQYISGYTKHDYHLRDNQDLYLEYGGNGNLKRVTVKTIDAYYQGYVNYKQEYVVEHLNTEEVPTTPSALASLTEDYVIDSIVEDTSGIKVTCSKLTNSSDIQEITVSPSAWASDGVQSFDVLYTRYANGRYIQEMKKPYGDYCDPKKFFMDGKKYEVKYHDLSEVNIPYSSVTIPTKYYIINNHVEIDGYTYEVDLDPANGTPTVTLKDGTQLLVKDHEKIKWEHWTQFILLKPNDYELTIEDISCANEYPYIEYGREPLYDKNKPFADAIKGTKEGHLYLEDYFDFMFTESGGTNEETASTLNYVKVDDEVFTCEKTSSSITINDVSYPIKTEWLNSEFGECLHLYPDTIDISFEGQQLIKVRSVKNLSQRCVVQTFEEDGLNNKLPKYITRDYIIYCGKYYMLADDYLDYIVINGIEYEIIKIRDEESEEEDSHAYVGQFISDDKPSMVKVSKEGETIKATIISSYINSALTDTNIAKYDVHSHRYVIVNNEKFRVDTIEKVTLETNDPLISEYVDIDGFEEFLLRVQDVEGSNKLRCTVIADDDEGCAYHIYANDELFEFKLINPLFDEDFVSIRKPYVYYDDDVKLSIFNPSVFFNLKLPLGIDVANNLTQEDIVNSQFYDVEKTKAINPYVDMEKDIYVPVFQDNEGINKLLNEIQFHLHFRTRDLSDWSINVDRYGEFSGVTKHSKPYYEAKNSETNVNVLTSGASVSSWNIFDYYYSNYATTDSEYASGETYMNFNGVKLEDDITNNHNLTNYLGMRGYVQPSDLVYFLNFTDDDIFYQKTKVGKTFLRISFYDSDNPKLQSLLHTSTIFLDENYLYKKYTDNSNEDGIEKLVFQSINDNTVINDFISTSFESLNAEKYKDGDEDGHKIYEFNDNKRLDATFKVTSHYNTQTSSEGFYLYIFKEYSDNLHERTIYMNIEFNHAGVGKTIKFFIPTKPKDDDGSKELLNFNNEDDVQLMKEGLSLNKLYESIYFPIKVVYDDKLKKYVYRFDDCMKDALDEDNGIMHLNLYEVKIKDESFEETT